MNHFLQVQPTDAQWSQIQTQETSPFTEYLLMDQNIVAGVPPVGYSLVYADPTDRINVASQSNPTQQIAYLSDIPAPPGVPSMIQAPDASAEVVCSNGGVIYMAQTPGFSVFSSSTSGGGTSVSSPQQLARLDVADGGDAYLVSPLDVRIDCVNLRYNGMIFPAADGFPGEFLSTNGFNNLQWSPLPPSITAPDGNAQMYSGVGGNNVIWNQTAGTAVFDSTTAGGTTTIASPDATAYVVCRNAGSSDVKSNTQVKVLAPQFTVNSLSYPVTDGLPGQVLVTNGANQISYVSPSPGLYSQTSLQLVANTATETALSTAGSGFFGWQLGSLLGSLKTNSQFSLRASGVWRNLNAAQTLRFRLLSGATVLYDTGVRPLLSVGTSIPWLLQLYMSYDGTQLNVTGGFRYSPTTNTFGGFESSLVTVISNAATVPLTLFVKWGTGNPQNTLLCSQINLTRDY